MQYTNNMTLGYMNILTEIIDNGVESTNMRTGSKVLTAPYPLFLRVDLRDGNVPLAGNRTIYPRVAAAEVAWQFQGTKDPTFIMKHAPKIWGNFIEEGELKTAYGHRWYNEFGRNQISLGLDALAKDSSNRQVYISTWDASCDGLGEPNQPANIPCIVGFGLTIVGGHLNMAVNMRSSDAYVGLPYDVATYSLMLDTFSATLGIKPGYLTFQLANCHLYGSHWDDATAELDTFIDWLENVQTVKMPHWTLQQVEDNPDSYVEYFKGIKIKNFNHTKPEVIV